MSEIGTEKRIEEIIRTYSDMVYRIAYQNLKSKADAEDIFQEVCISLITKPAPIDDEKHIKNWLIRVTINKCNNFHKSFWQSRLEPLDEQLEAMEQDSRDLMWEIWRLPKIQRNIIYLYYYEGYTIAEISQILNINQNTVSSSLQRGRKKLRKALEEGGFNNG